MEVNRVSVGSLLFWASYRFQQGALGGGAVGDCTDRSRGVSASTGQVLTAVLVALGGSVCGAKAGRHVRPAFAALVLEQVRAECRRVALGVCWPLLRMRTGQPRRWISQMARSSGVTGWSLPVRSRIM